MRTAFINTLIDLARTDKRIFLLVGDLGYSVVEPFRDEFPDRFINIGVAEQNMIGVATGLALSGKTVFVYSIANFPTLRCLEQIRNDTCYHKANVKIVAVGGGFVYGSAGMTHHATEDLAIMRALPNMTVIAPADPIEASLATKEIAQMASPCYLRLSKAGDPPIHTTIPDFKIGKAIIVRDGKDITLIAIGGIVHNAIQTAQQLTQQGIEARVLSMHTLKPLDTAAILKVAQETHAIITIEEHSIMGGLGSAVAEVLAESESHIPFKRMGIKDSFYPKVGSQEYLRKLNGLSIDDIITMVIQLSH